MILKEYSTIDEPSMASNRMPNRQEVKKLERCSWLVMFLKLAFQIHFC